jgi:ABC-type transporter Mla maintaining outer membrane lipid asymmetry ATPase subunit MlaF
MKSAYRIADKIAMLYEGKVIMVGTTSQIKSSEISEVKEFVRDRTAMITQNESQQKI